METKLNVKLISNTMNPELVIATAGKLCYSPSNIEALMEKQTPEDTARFVNMLASMGHESPLEHVSFSFAVEGVSRSLTHQLVRHRIASYSQQSQRYVREGQFEYVIPEDIKKHESLKVIYLEHMKDTQRTYDNLVDGLMCLYTCDEVEFSEYLSIQLSKLGIDELEFRTYIKEMGESDFTVEKFLNDLKDRYKRLYSVLEKKAIENARYVLPNAAETKIIVTMNLRTLINFCNHRCCRRAQEEINQLAWKMVEEVEKVSPLLAKNLGATCQFGACKEGKMCCMQPYPKKK